MLAVLERLCGRRGAIRLDDGDDLVNEKAGLPVAFADDQIDAKADISSAYPFVAVGKRGGVMTDVPPSRPDVRLLCESLL